MSRNTQNFVLRCEKCSVQCCLHATWKRVNVMHNVCVLSIYSDFLKTNRTDILWIKLCFYRGNFCTKILSE